MGIFSGIKNKILRRKESDLDYSGIRSTVLNEPPPVPEGRQAYEPPPAEPPEPRFLKSPRFEEPTPTPYDERYRTPTQRRYEELGFETPTPNYPAQQQPERYDIAERLNLIEAQLSAIRSQTETINERLKNIEMRLPRRY